MMSQKLAKYLAENNQAVVLKHGGETVGMVITPGAIEKFYRQYPLNPLEAQKEFFNSINKKMAEEKKAEVKLHDIKKVKIKNDGVVEVSYLDIAAGKSMEATCKYNHKAHSDLRFAFRNLVPHFVLLSESIPENKIKDFFTTDKPHVKSEMIEKHMSDYTVFGVTIKDKEEGKGVVLSATRKLKSGKYITINAPYTCFSDNDGDYDYNVELAKGIDKLVQETNQYMNGKAGSEIDPDQEEMFKEDDEEGKEE